MRITNTSTATWAVIALVVAMGSINATLKAQDSRAIAKTVMPSVVLLTTLDSSGQPMSLGSGFVVGDGLVATNLHVISGASRGFAKLPNAEDKFPIQGTCGVDSVHDLAILSIPGLKATALHLGDSDQIAPGDAIYVVGNPEGLEGTFSTGVVSAVRKTGDDLLLQLTAPISPGSSGGPMTNAKGEVIGISVATLKDGQNLNFAIPSHYLASLLAKPTAVTSLVASATQPVAQGVGEISGAVWINMNDGSSNLQRGFQIWVMTADPLPRSVVTSCLGTAVSEHQKAVDQTLKSIKSMQDTFLADADVSLFTDSLKNDRDEIAQIQLAIGQLPAKMSVTDAFRLVTLFSEDDIPSFADAVDANLAKETRTDVDGKYTIGGLSEGDYFLRAEILHRPLFI
jgi:S1-C subfamily serine protease